MSVKIFSVNFCLKTKTFNFFSNTVFPRIVSAETIQGRKLFKGGNYSWKYSIWLQASYFLKPVVKFIVIFIEETEPDIPYHKYNVCHGPGSCREPRHSKFH